jgi:hypothetical protein
MTYFDLLPSDVNRYILANYREKIRDNDEIFLYLFNKYFGRNNLIISAPEYYLNTLNNIFKNDKLKSNFYIYNENYILMQLDPSDIIGDRVILQILYLVKNCYHADEINKVLKEKHSKYRITNREHVANSTDCRIEIVY